MPKTSPDKIILRRDTMLVKDELVGRVVKVRYYRTQGYPAGSLARVLGWTNCPIHKAKEPLYELEFSDGTVIFVPRDEFILTQRKG